MATAIPQGTVSGCPSALDLPSKSRQVSGYADDGHPGENGDYIYGNALYSGVLGRWRCVGFS